MTEPSNEEVVRGYLDAVANRDLDEATRLRHRDWVSEWPQSGERVRGDDNWRAIDEAFPGGHPDVRHAHVVGSEDRWVMTPAFTFQRMVGSGQFWWADGDITYANGETWKVVILLEVLDRQIHREVVFYAEPFEAPEWRASYVERMD